VEEMKIYNLFETVKSEIKNISLRLQEVCGNNSKLNLYLEKSKPFNLKEVSLSFLLYDPKVFEKQHQNPFDEKEKSEDRKLFTELFDIQLISSTKVHELRKTVFSQLSASNIPLPPSENHIRLREVYCLTPSAIFPISEDLNLADVTENILYHGKHIAVEILEFPEPVKTKQVSISLQRWNPSSFTFGPRKEIVVDKNLSIEELRINLSKEHGISSVGLAKSTKCEVFHSEMSSLSWDPSIPLFVANRKVEVGTISSCPFFLSDGNVLFFRDNNEKEKEINAKDRSKLEVFARENKINTFIVHKEKSKK